MIKVPDQEPAVSKAEQLHTVRRVQIATWRKLMTLIDLSFSALLEK
jgi:hypothetical protein